MGRVKQHYHNLLSGGELENVPSIYRMNPEEVHEMIIEEVNTELRIISQLQQSEFDNYSE
jgi:hypothetical protein